MEKKLCRSNFGRNDRDFRRFLSIIESRLFLCVRACVRASDTPSTICPRSLSLMCTALQDAFSYRAASTILLQGKCCDTFCSDISNNRSILDTRYDTFAVLCFFIAAKTVFFHHVLSRKFAKLFKTFPCGWGNPQPRGFFR